MERSLVPVRVHAGKLSTLATLAYGVFGNHPPAHIKVALSFGSQLNAAFAAYCFALEVLVSRNSRVQLFELWQAGALAYQIGIAQHIRITRLGFIQHFGIQ